MSLHLQLRQVVTNALGPLTGTYQTSSGPRPAIAVVPPQLDNRRTVTGLEVVISRSPIYEVQGLLGSAAQQERTWTIRLVQWDRNKTTQEAIEALYRTFPKMDSTILESTDIAEEQAVIRVTEGSERIKLTRI